MYGGRGGGLAARLSDVAFEKVEAALLAVIVITGQHNLSRGEYRGFSQRRELRGGVQVKPEVKRSTLEYTANKDFKQR